jgi:Spy/CpxP family protein refolding chaperone
LPGKGLRDSPNLPKTARSRREQAFNLFDAIGVLRSVTSTGNGASYSLHREMGMSWIRLAVAGIALCAGASVASAQGAPPQGGPQGGGPGMRGGRGMAMLFEGITLTDAQQKSVQDIGAKYREQMMALMPNGMGGGPPDDATRAKMTDLRTKQQAEIRALLTSEQQTVFDKNVAEAKKRRETQTKQ